MRDGSNNISSNKEEAIGLLKQKGFDIKKIEDFLKKHNIASSGNKYAVGLTKKADQCIIDKATSIWDECKLRDSHYLYIRKYNMPKKSIFPAQMLDDPNLFINVFYRNKELYDMP